MKIKFLNHILTIDLLTAVLILVITFVPLTVIRVILGLPLLLFFPGYLLWAALFVNKKSMDGLERLAVSCVMSISVVALIGFGLNYTSWGIGLEPVLYSLTSFIILTSIAALIRQARIQGKLKLTSEINLRLRGWEIQRGTRRLSLILIICIIIAGGVLGYVMVMPELTGTYTEFYVLGSAGKTQDYPAEFTMANGRIVSVQYDDSVIASEWGQVTIGITNFTKQTADYFVKITIGGQPTDINYKGTIFSQVGNIRLQNGETWEDKIGFAPQLPGENQKVELLLFEGDSTTPEDSLNFWINVKTAP